MGVGEQVHVLAELGVLQHGGQVLREGLHVDDVVSLSPEARLMYIPEAR